MSLRLAWPESVYIQYIPLSFSNSSSRILSFLSLLPSLPPPSPSLLLSLHTTEESFQVLSYNAQWHEDELSQVNVVVGPALKETALEHVQKKLNTIPLHDSSVL